MADMVLDVWLIAHDQFEGVFKKMGVEVEGLRGKIGLLAGGMGVLAGGALAESVKQASDWQRTISEVAANTNMTTAQMNQMSAVIKDMASSTSAPMEDLARGYEHIGNFGYRGADATNILRAAMESAVSTGSNTADVANMLANVMKEYGFQTRRAGDAINVMHSAAAMGNMRLAEFVEYGGRAIGMAAGLKIPLTDVSAAMAALTQHGEDAARAGTDVAGLLNHLVSPSKHARDELAYLSHVTGIDLVHDFSVAGLHAKGLSGVLADLQKATGGNKELLDQLIPAIHGGYAAFQLTNQGAADFQRILSALNDTMAGKTNPTAEAYARTQQTVAFQLGVLKNNLHLMALSIGEAVLPALNRLLGAILPVVRGITHWIGQHSSLVAGLLAGVAVVGTLIGALLVLGPIIAAIASPIGIVVVAIGAAIAGIAALASSSEEVRNILAGIWSAIADAAGALWLGLTGIWNGISGDAMLLWENLGSWLNQTWSGIVSAAAPIWNGLTNAIKYVWDRITGDKDAAGAALRAIPAEWRPLLQAIGDVFSGTLDGVRYVWDSLTGNAKDARAALAAIPPSWRPLVQNIAHVFEGLKADVGKAWAALGAVLRDVARRDMGPALRDMGRDWTKFAHEIAPLLGPAIANVARVLGGAGAVLGSALGTAINVLKHQWTGFWEGGARQFVHDGLQLCAQEIRLAVKFVEDAITFLLAVVAGKWDVAWKKLKDMVGDQITGVVLVLRGGARLVGDAAGALVGSVMGVFEGLANYINNKFLSGAVRWGEQLIENLKKGIGKVAHQLYDAVRDALGPIGKLFPKSPAEEGPLSIPPDFRYIGDAMRHAIPHVRSAATDLMGAAGLGGGAFGLDVGASGASGGTFNAGHTVTVAPHITIQGGTFTDKQGIADLAHKVSEEIMHSVRLQGGLLPQM